MYLHFLRVNDDVGVMTIEAVFNQHITAIDAIIVGVHFHSR